MNGYSHKVHMSLATLLAFATIMLLALLTLFTFYATNRLELYNVAVDKTYDIQQILAELEGDMSQLESSQQGYLLTNDDGYLTDIQDERQRISSSLAQLKVLSREDTGLWHRFRLIAPAVNRYGRDIHISVLPGMAARRVETREQSRSSGAAARAQISAARAETATLLAQRMADVTANSDEAQILVTADVALVIFALVLVILIIRRDHSAQVNHYIEIVEEQKRNLEQANKELSELARRDGLTGLVNHRAFHERLATEFTLLARQAEPISLLMIDVDRFKEYNDMFGHPAGDAVLARIARILDDSGRATDVVARYGGEEFAILLPTTDLHGACDLAERLRRSVAAEAWESEAVTISVGVASSMRSRTEPADLLAMADQALYRSKSNGRNRVTIAEPSTGGAEVGTPMHAHAAV